MPRRQKTKIRPDGTLGDTEEAVSWKEYMARVAAMERRADQQLLEKRRKEAGFCPACGNEKHPPDQRPGKCDGRMTR